jgi:hypothetical protein
MGAKTMAGLALKLTGLLLIKGAAIKPKQIAQAKAKAKKGPFLTV